MFQGVDLYTVLCAGWLAGDAYFKWLMFILLYIFLISSGSGFLCLLVGVFFVLLFFF